MPTPTTMYAAQREMTASGRIAAPIRLVDQYDDGESLLRAADRLGIEGIVSKRKASAYVAGRTRHWMKIKTVAWKVANAKRGELFGQ